MPIFNIQLIKDYKTNVNYNKHRKENWATHSNVANFINCFNFLFDSKNKKTNIHIFFYHSHKTQSSGEKQIIRRKISFIRKYNTQKKKKNRLVFPKSPISGFPYCVVRTPYTMFILSIKQFGYVAFGWARFILWLGFNSPIACVVTIHFYTSIFTFMVHWGLISYNLHNQCVTWTQS